MALKFGTIGIIADDLTGANDTALQFLLKGANTQILLDYKNIPEGCNNTIVWAINTESRLVEKQQAIKQVNAAANALLENLQVDFIYKKIDSTLRGNIAAESLGLIEHQDWDAALIVPAFPDEGRITVGGYHLLRCIPIERTEVARDPTSPIHHSHIPTLLAHQVDNPDIIGHISLKKVMRGAAPILMELQELIKKGKKLIVVDAASNVDLEQIVLAMEKALGHHKILPCGSAGLAYAITKSWMTDVKYKNIIKTVPDYPSLIVVGSVTPITRSQIKLLKEYKDSFNLEFINLEPEHLVEGIGEDIEEHTINLLRSGKSVVVYSAPLEVSVNKTVTLAETKNIKQPKLSQIILERLSSFTAEVVNSVQVKLILVGGETASKCCRALHSMHLQLIDEVDHAIPLCLDQKAQFIITKSGNLGTPKTLVNIISYIKNLEEKSQDIC